MERGLRGNPSFDSSATDKFAKSSHGTHRQPVGDQPCERKLVEAFRLIQIQEPGKPVCLGCRQAGRIGIGFKGVQIGFSLPAVSNH